MKRVYLSENGGLKGKRGQKQKKDKTERATGLARKTKEEIYRKVRSNYESNTEGTNFRIMLICFKFV